MTIKEFAKKYDVPYNLVYDATYRVKPESTWMRDRDYPEQALHDEIVSILRKRIGRLERSVVKNRTFLDKLGS